MSTLIFLLTLTLTLTLSLISPTQVRLGISVREIAHDAGGARLQLSDGGELTADYIIVTLPLGVLKRPPEAGGVRFTPPLSAPKREAIARLGMGTENKVVLRWAVADIFWPAAVPYLQCTDQRFRFLNLHHFGKPGVLLVMRAPPFSIAS